MEGKGKKIRRLISTTSISYFRAKIMIRKKIIYSIRINILLE